MVTIYLCDSEYRAQSSWSRKMAEELKDVHRVLLPTSIAVPTDRSSLDRFVAKEETLEVPDMGSILDSDVVVANASGLTFEVTVSVIAASVYGKLVVIFREGSGPTIPSLLTLGDLYFESHSDALSFLRNISATPRKEKDPVTNFVLEAITYKLQRCYMSEDRRDPEFRGAIFASQVGQLLRFMTHDPDLNKNAKPAGTRAEEESQFGDALVQLVIYLISRGLDFKSAYTVGMKRMEEKTWRQESPAYVPLRELGNNEIGYGIAASNGEATGNALVVKSVNDARELDKRKYIVVMGSPLTSVWNEVKVRLDYILGIITEAGGEYSHVAVVCRETNKPCIVGVSGASSKISTGQKITMIVDKPHNSIRRAA